ncbi:MAG TPA: PAS domain S-box protein [Polyangiaceae bacterium]|nr:PAS domain S-box protein [Polyangiaceae bacterium]
MARTDSARESICQLLTSGEVRYELVQAETSEAASEMLERTPRGNFACILFDARTSASDTAHALQSLLDSNGQRRLPVIVILNENDEWSELSRLGVTDYVRTGWLNAESLGRAVEHALENERLTLRVRNAEARLQSVVSCLTDPVGVGASRVAPGLPKDQPKTCFDCEWLHDSRRIGERAREEVVRDPSAAVRALAAGEARLRLALEASSTGLWTWDVADDAVTWSPECYSISGLKRGEFAGTGAAFFELVHPEDRERVREKVLGAISNQSLYQCVFRIVRPNREIVWVENRGRASYAPSGMPLEMLGTITDVNARVHAEQAARRAEALAQAATNGADALVFAKDLGGRYFFFNDKWLEFCGLTRDQAAGLTDAQLFGSDAEGLLANDSEVVRTGKAVRFEERIQHDGSDVTLLSSKFPLVDAEGKLFGLCGVSVDISELKRLQAALRARERELQTLADNIPDILARFDRGLRHVYVNASVEAATGRPRADFLLKTNRELGMPEDLCAVWDAALTRVFESGEPTSIEFSFEQGGERSFYESRLVPEANESDEVEYVAAITQNITVRHDYEQALLEADRRKDEFLATLAHELRNPLAPVRTGIDVLKHGADPRVAQNTLRMMDRQLQQFIRLIDDLLDVARITTGKISLRRERTALATVVDAAIEAVKPKIDSSGHALSVELAAEPLYVVADSARLTQVLSNLLTNAAKYTPRGGAIRVTLRREADQAVVDVADNGVGIPREMLHRVFEMFTQINRSIEQSQGGLGIGLSLVKRIVEMHGGSVTASSAGAGLGSCFTVMLPLESALPAPSPESKAAR